MAPRTPREPPQVWPASTDKRRGTEILTTSPKRYVWLFIFIIVVLGVGFTIGLNIRPGTVSGPCQALLHAAQLAVWPSLDACLYSDRHRWLEGDGYGESELDGIPALVGADAVKLGLDPRLFRISPDRHRTDSDRLPTGNGPRIHVEIRRSPGALVFCPLCAMALLRYGIERCDLRSQLG